MKVASSVEPGAHRGRALSVNCEQFKSGMVMLDVVYFSLLFFVCLFVCVLFSLRSKIDSCACLTCVDRVIDYALGKLGKHGGSVTATLSSLPTSASIT